MYGIQYMNKTIFTPQILRYDDFRDLEIIKDISQGWDILWTYIKAGGTDASIWVVTTPRMQFSKVSYNNAIMIESSPPVGSVQLSFIRTKGACSSHNQKLKDNDIYTSPEIFKERINGIFIPANQDSDSIYKN